jgi:NAD-dependent dihydropyrimidine dehydrogenase PreA subunit
MARDYDWNRLGERETDYRPRRKGLGIRDAIKDKTAATKDDDRFGQWFFRTIIAAAPLTKFPPTDALIKGVAMMGGTHNTKGVSMPFWVNGEKPQGACGGVDGAAADDAAADGAAAGNVASAPTTVGNVASAPATGGNIATAVAAPDVAPAPGRGTSKSAPGHHGRYIPMDVTPFSTVEQVKPPTEMLHEAVEDATFLAIMHECLCRKIQGCTDYPTDLGCLFLGPAARVCVERGIAYEATKEQAHAHIERAKAVGLSASAYFVEVEEYVWGFRDRDMPNFLEICFCCPCCCSAVRFEHGAGGELKRILHQRSGWSCVVDRTRCVGCGACAKVCPHDCMHLVDGRAQANQWCAGCGQCLKACTHDALGVYQTGEVKPHVMDHFAKLHAQI